MCLSFWYHHSDFYLENHLCVPPSQSILGHADVATEGGMWPRPDQSLCTTHRDTVIGQSWACDPTGPVRANPFTSADTEKEIVRFTEGKPCTAG